MLYWEVTQALLTAVLRELGAALGEDAFGGDYGSIAVHNAHGLRADGTAWTNVATCGGDLDTDLEDYWLFQQCFGAIVIPGEHCSNADLNGDGVVNELDLTILVVNLTGPF